MNKLFIAASAAALLTAAGTVPSLAQSSSSGASSMTMPSITCRDLSGMDQQTARNVVFYLGGLHAAQGSSSAMNSTTGTTGSGSSSTSADAGSTGGASSTTGSSDTSGSSSTTADSGASGSTTDTTGSTTAAGSSSSSSGSSSGTVVTQLPGFAMINADQILSTCQSSPDKQLSEVLGSASSTAQ